MTPLTTPGDIVAAYEYDAFGRTLRESGAYAGLNPFRFSTKYTDTETDLVYYGHRYYAPGLGRFINRDPKEEQGGVNLYTFVLNNAIDKWDYIGLNPPDETDDTVRDGSARDSGGSPNLVNNGITDISGGWNFSENYGSSDLLATLQDLEKIAAINAQLASGNNVTVQDATGRFYTLTPGDRTTFSDGGKSVSIGGYGSVSSRANRGDTIAQAKGVAPNSGAGNVTVNTTTFIPMGSVTDPLGATYKGDSRNLWDSGTHRSSQTVVIDPSTHAVVSTTNDIGTSVRLSPFASGPIQSTGSFTVSSSTNYVTGITTITMTGSVTNNAFVLRPIPSPSIDYQTTITVYNNGSVAVQTNHDGFPGYEVSVNGQHTYGYDPRTSGTGPGALWGSGDTNSGLIHVKR